MRGWHDQALQLRAQGLSIRQIAAEVGMSRGPVGELFKPRTFPPCGECGEPVSSSQSVVCHACYRANSVATRKRIVEMWAAGATWPEIGEELGWTRNRVSAEVSRIRRMAPDLLPHRYGDERRRNMAAARWGKAA